MSAASIHHAPNHRPARRIALNDSSTPARTSDVQLYAEIAARLIELHDGNLPSTSPSGRTPLMWLLRVAKLAHASPAALWLYLRLQAGDTSNLSDTYTELASRHAGTRGNMARDLDKTCSIMALHYPELGATVVQLRRYFHAAHPHPTVMDRARPGSGIALHNNEGTSEKGQA